MRCIIFLLAFCAIISAYADKVRLADIQVLTFQKGMVTTGRRSPGVPQLQCVNCNHQNQDKVTSVQCRNVGTDGRDVNWKCETSVSKEWELGLTSVSCEGFDYPDDPYVLVGSCGLEYQLKRNTNYVPTPIYRPVTPTYETSSFTDSVNLFVGGTIFLIVVISVVMLVLTATPQRVVRETRTVTVNPPTNPYTERPTAPSYSSVSNEVPVMTQTTTSYSQPERVTTRVEHHYQPVQPVARNSGPDFVDGFVLGSLSTSVNQRPVVVQPVQPIFVQPVQPVQPVQQVVIEKPSTDNIHTSTSFATTKRR